MRLFYASIKAATARVFEVLKSARRTRQAGRQELRPYVIALVAILVLVIAAPPVSATTCVTSGDNVVITTNCIFDAGTYTFTGTLTINPGVTVTAASNVGSGQVILVSDSIRIDGTLTANGTGYAAGACGGSGTGPGAGTTTGSGGGYGGYGGSSSDPSVNGLTYGSVTQPTDRGSSGGYGSGCFGGTPGTGAGAIKLVASSGTVVVAGTVSANGTTSTAVTGGGAGGSIWIDAGTLTGGGTISAIGGNGSSHGGGGGGRIALYYDTDSSTGTRNAYGGTKGGFAQNGGAGTIFTDDKDDGLTNGNLLVDNNNLASAAGTVQVTTFSQTYDAITIRKGANYVIPNSHTLTLPSGGAVTVGGTLRPTITVNSGGVLDPNTASWSIEGLNVVNTGTINTSTSLTFIGSDLTLSGTGTFQNAITSLNLNGFSSVSYGSATPNFNLTSLDITTLGSVTVTTSAPYYPFGSGFTTLNVSGRYTADHANRLFLDTLNVNSGGTVTHATNTSTTVKNRQLDISATTTIRVNSGGAISANHKGFTESSCAGAGLGPGGGAANGAGGGYGGRGGTGTSSSFGATYGSVTEPTDIGSAGGPAAGCFGGFPSFGGGAVKLTSPGTIIVAGTISSNGNNPTTVEGGGSGGSVWIDVPNGTLTGGGTISANGGAGSGGSGDGGGGGGRIALYYATDSGTGTRSAFGGARGGSAQNGGAGTVYKYQTGVSTLGDLIVDNNNLTSAAGTAQVTTLSQQYDDVTLRNGANYLIPNLFTFTLPVGGAVTTGGSAARPKITVDAGGTFNPNAASWSDAGLDLVVAGTVTTVTSLTMTGADLTMSGAGTFASPLTTLSLSGFSNLTHNGTNPNFNLTSLDITTLGSVTVTTSAPYYPFGSGFTTLNVSGRYTADHANRLFLDTLNVNSGGTVTHATNTSTTVKDRQLDISATTTIRVNSGGTISANAKGFGPGTCGATTGRGPGAATGGGAGGGYGGRGGFGSASTSLGNTYGSVTQPTDIGSSGSYSAGCFGGTTSQGGGALKLTTPGTLIVAGTVSSNGSSPTAVSGGGSGGSIWIDASSGTLTGGGTISANGGVGSGGSPDGGGGGGRVALYYTTDSGTGTRSAFGGARGGNGQNGGAGTVYKKATVASNGDLVVDNTNLTSAAGTAQVTTSSQTYDNVTVRNGGIYMIPSGFTLTIPGGGALAGGGTALPVLDIRSGGTFNPPSASMTFDGLNVTHTGLFNTLTALTVKNSVFTSSNTNFVAGLASLTADSGGSYVSSSSINSLTVSGTITVKSGGLLTHATNTNAHASSLNISAANLDIQAGGSVSVNGKGFTSSEGTGQGGDNATAGSGAGHGGAGGASSAGTAGGGTYGSDTQPATLGSGGGNDSTSGTVSEGGAGGGAIKIVLTGTLTLNGSLTANGVAATGSSDFGGGGAGGSIWFDVITATLNANPTASGGAGSGSGATGGGGGGGGRVAAYYVALTGSGTSTVTGGAKGGTGAAVAGSNGSAFSQVNPPVVTVTEPDGGESLTGGQHTDITYTSAGTIDHFRISLSTDGGSSFSTVVTNSATSGPFDWTITNVSTTQGRIKVEAMNSSDVALASDISNADFTIAGGGGGGGGDIPASVTIGQPNGGEQLTARSTYTVLYSSQGSQVSAIRLSYSTDGGSSWTVITSSASKADGFYAWSVPDINASSVTMKAEALSGGTAMASDTSDGSFSIAGGSIPPPEPEPEPTLVLTDPNGGETVVSGRSYAIRWIATGSVPSLTLSYSADGGASFAQIVSGVSAAAGSYAWAVPIRSATTTAALVKIVGDGMSDVSAGAFTITPAAATQEQQEALDALGLQEPPMTVSSTSHSDELLFSFSKESQSEASSQQFGVQEEGTGLWVVPATNTGTVDQEPQSTARSGNFFEALRGAVASVMNRFLGIKTATAQTVKKYALGPEPYYQSPTAWGDFSILTELSDQRTYTLTVVQKPADPSQPGTSLWTASAATPSGLVAFDVSKRIRTVANDANPDEASVSPGTVLTYEFVLRNTGNRRAKYVTLIDPFPSGTTYVANSLTSDGSAQTDADDADIAHVEPRQAVWKWYAMEIGASHTVTLRLRTTTASDGTTIENVGRVQAQGTTADPNPAPSTSNAVAQSVSAPAPYCGDAACNDGESHLSCVRDCPAPVCGNARCESGENPTNCIQDCEGPVEAICGNAVCEAPETYRTCTRDCEAPVCGNDICEYSETSSECVLDCRPAGLSDEQWQIRIDNELRSVPSDGATTPPPTGGGGGSGSPAPEAPSDAPSEGGTLIEAIGEGVKSAADAVVAAFADIGAAIADVADSLVRTDETMGETPILDALERSVETVPVLGPAVRATRDAVKAVRANETAQTVNEIIVTPTVVATSAVSTTAAVGFAGFARYSLFLITQPLALLQRRRRKAYGVVYNAGTKMPVDLAIVRLLDAQGVRQIATRVTDRAGRFLFIVPPGAYKIELRKEGFSFPPSRHFATAGDGPYLDVQLTQDVVTKDGVISKNLPMEPTGDLRPASQVIADRGWASLQWGFVAVGPSLAVAQYVATPKIEQVLALLAHLLLFLIFTRIARARKFKNWGTVKADGKPVKQAVVRVTESAYNKILDSQVTDARGRYAFLVGQNQYFLTAEHAGYQPVKTDVIDFSKAPEPAVIAKDIELKAAPIVSPPTSA